MLPLKEKNPLDIGVLSFDFSSQRCDADVKIMRSTVTFLVNDCNHRVHEDG